MCQEPSSSPVYRLSVFSTPCEKAPAFGVPGLPLGLLSARPASNSAGLQLGLPSIQPIGCPLISRNMPVRAAMAENDSPLNRGLFARSPWLALNA